jgi:hypothetical protein
MTKVELQFLGQHPIELVVAEAAIGRDAHTDIGGQVLPRLSYAKRRTKLFTRGERPLWSARRKQVDVRSWTAIDV